MDILFVTETWLKPHGDEGRLHDLTPVGYIAKSFLRESRDGGIAVVYNKCLSKPLVLNLWGIPHLWGMASCQVGNFVHLFSSQNRLIDLESNLRCAISKVEPNIEALVQAKQMQKSH